MRSLIRQDGALFPLNSHHGDALHRIYVLTQCSVKFATHHLPPPVGTARYRPAPSQEELLRRISAQRTTHRHPSAPAHRLNSLSTSVCRHVPRSSRRVSGPIASRRASAPRREVLLDHLLDPRLRGCLRPANASHVSVPPGLDGQPLQHSQKKTITFDSHASSADIQKKTKKALILESLKPCEHSVPSTRALCENAGEYCLDIDVK